MFALSILVLVSIQGLYADPVKHIIGGEEARPPGSIPWQGYLESGVVPSFSCGCILVDKNIALTAAHCADSGNVDNFFVTFGAHDRETKLEGQPETYSVRSITVHPNASGIGREGFPNDIAVLELGSDANTDSIYIEPIALPESGRNPGDWLGQDCMISGWGRTEGGITGPLPNVMQRADIDVITEEECQDLWSEEQIGDMHVCVYDNVTKARGACSGDSGGPLVCRESESAPYELVGITSWGSSGCTTTLPSVYVRVSTFREWIDEVLANILP